MADLYPVREAKLFNGAKTILASANADSVAINLEHIAPQGMFALYNILTGDGTAKITYKVCPTKDGTYVTPADAVDILTAQTKTPGVIHQSFEPEVTKWLKINFEETGGANSIIISALSVLLFQ